MLEATKEGRNSAIIFLLGVVAIVVFGFLPRFAPVLRPRKAKPSPST